MKTFFKYLFSILSAGILLLVVFTVYLITLNADPVKKPERQMSEVWADYPFESHYITVKGSNMHYIDEGAKDGPVVLFLHGNPTSSYLWRNILPTVAATGVRAIAVDNVGFGASDRPDIGYTFVEQAEYIEGFIEAMDLQDITLVIHDWGSALGFDYAYRYQDNVKGIVFMEAFTRVPRIAAGANTILSAFRGPGLGELLIMGGNLFVEGFLPKAIVRELKPEEMAAYREPFPTIGSRMPTLVWPRQIPFNGEPEDVAERIDAYAQWLPTSNMPKLLLHFKPGASVRPENVEQMRETWNLFEGKQLGSGLHFVQEDQPEAIAEAIIDWRGRVFESVQVDSEG